MYLIDGHGLFGDGFIALSCHVHLVAPLVAGEGADDGAGLRAHFRAESIGVGLEAGDAVAAHYHIAVAVTGLDSGYEAFPDAAAVLGHLAGFLAPAGALTQGADTLGVGSPQTETHAADTVFPADMGAHFLIGLEMTAFVEKVAVVAAE